MRHHAFATAATAFALVALSSHESRAEGPEDPPEGYRPHVLDYVTYSGSAVVASASRLAHERPASVTRTAPGVYRALLTGTQYANVQASAYGAVHGFCNVDSWTPEAPGLTIVVRCFDAAARPQDMGFSVVAMWQGNTPPVSTLRYGWIAQPMSQSETARQPMLYRSGVFVNGPSIVVRTPPPVLKRTAAGAYTTRSGSETALWFATPTGPLPRRCRGYTTPNEMGVQCSAIDTGAPADATVSFAVLKDATLTPRVSEGGYARFAANGQPFPNIGGAGTTAWSSNGGRVSAVREAAGRYRVRFERHASITPGVALVSGGCRVTGLANEGGDRVVSVDCNADADFDVILVR